MVGSNSVCRRTSNPTRWPIPVRSVVAAAVLACVALLGAPGVENSGVGISSVWAAPDTEARSAAETYERKSTIKDCLRYVASDLAGRAKAAPKDGPAQLLLVIDPTVSMKDEIEGLRDVLAQAWEVGPRGLRIGVFDLGTLEYIAPNRNPRFAMAKLSSLAFAPVPGPRSLHHGLRAAADAFADVSTEPKAMLLITQDGGEAEDDVEATRDAVFDSGAALYCVAGEAGFERAWLQTYTARDVPAKSLTERFNPHPRRCKTGEQYYGSEVAFGLLPYAWEANLAQMAFRWVRPPNYPVPSGFGYWNLATLCNTSGGRYFIYDFSAPAMSAKRNDQRKTMFDFSRMRLLAPDLRPRKQILKSLASNKWAQTIVKIWEHLANEAVPIVQETATLERRGGLVSRPARAVRAKGARSPMYTWYEDMDQVREAISQAKARVQAVDKALKWWGAANGREREASARSDPLAERVEANFQLLGVQLRKVRFHWGEILAALSTVRPLDVTYRRVRIRGYPAILGIKMPAKGLVLDGGERDGRLAELMLAQDRVAKRYAKTPWALVLEKGYVLSMAKDVHVIPRQTPAEIREEKERKEGKGKGKRAKPKPPAPRPPTNAPPGPKPGSGAGGPTTGG